MITIVKSFFRFSLGLIRLNKTITYHGDQKTLLEMMDQLVIDSNNGKALLCKKVSDKEYVFSHREFEPIEMEIDLVILQPHITEQVRVEVQILQQNDRLQLLQCSGKIRLVHLLIFFFYVFLVGGRMLSEKGISLNGWVLLSVLFLIVHVIANHFWSRKEQYVVDKLKQALRLQMKLNK
jgi:hypothetical protein